MHYSAPLAGSVQNDLRLTVRRHRSVYAGLVSNSLGVSLPTTRFSMHSRQAGQLSVDAVWNAQRPPETPAVSPNAITRDWSSPPRTPQA